MERMPQPEGAEAGAPAAAPAPAPGPGAAASSGAAAPAAVAGAGSPLGATTIRVLPQTPPPATTVSEAAGTGMGVTGAGPQRTGGAGSRGAAAPTTTTTEREEAAESKHEPGAALATTPLSAQPPTAQGFPLLAQTSFRGIGRGTSFVALPTGAADQELLSELYQPGMLTGGGAGAGEEGAVEEGGPEEGGPGALPSSPAKPGAAAAAAAGPAAATTAAAGAIAGETAKAPGTGAPAPAAAAAEGKAKDYDEHMLTLPQLAARYGTAIDAEHPDRSAGLEPGEAATRLARDGPNALTPPRTVPEWRKFLRQFGNLLMVLLEVAAVLAFIAWGLDRNNDNVILGGALVVMIILTCIMTYYQEKQANNVLASIRGMLPSSCKVVRGGKEFSTPATDLVVGDLVHLTIGNRVPADLRIISAADYKVEMSSLTGESDAVECGPVRKSELPMESRCLIFSSGLTMNGSCYGVVIRTGDHTLVGSINTLAGSTRSTHTTLELEILRLVRFVVIIAMVTALIFFAIGLARGLGIVFSFVNAFILVIIANTPEGLPATVTSILSITAQEMAKRNVLIKRADLIETLGAATVICSDKTGTLTQNKMTVENLWYNRSFVYARGRVRHVPAGAPPGADPLEAMTIGRGMSVIGGRAIIHSTTVRGIGALGPGVTSPGGTLGGMTTAGRGRQPYGGAGAGAGGGGGTTAGWRSRTTRPALSGAFPGGGTPAGTSAAEGGRLSPAIAEEEGGGIEHAPSAPAGHVEARSPAVAGRPTISGIGEGTSMRIMQMPSGVLSRPSRVAPGSATTATIGRGGAGGRSVTLAPPSRAESRYFGGPGSAMPGGSISRQGSYLDTSGPHGFAAIASFNSFRGFTQANWSKSNAFTRLVTIAAVCNKANFSYGEEEPPPGGAAAGEEGGTDATAGTGTGTAAPTATKGGKRGAAAAHLRGRGRAGTTKAGRGTAAAAPGIPSVTTTDTRKVLGDASEAALLRYTDSLVPIFEFRSAYPVLAEQPFNSMTKTAHVITVVPEDHSKHLMLLKGAPERVIDRCSHHYQNGQELPITQEFRADWLAAYERFGSFGERVLGFAYRVFPARTADEYKTDETSYPHDGLVFAGLASLVDPPKPGTDEAVAVCRKASIRVTMVTGDHPLTAEAIARKVGIITLPTAREIAAADGVEEESIALSDPRVKAVVMPGYAIPALSQADWDTLLAKDEVVFARTSPQQKLQIVGHYQRLGHVVAVTGDGTNDAPALKAAQIGVSMGGPLASDVARETADLVLLDDSFASIVAAIAMGRTVFDNIKKSTAYTVTHLWPELIPVFCVLVFDMPLMLPGLLVLLLDLVTEQGPAISLSYEPAEALVMARPPRNIKTERLISRPLILYCYIYMGLLETMVCILAFLTTMSYYGIPGSAIIYNRQLWTESSPDLVVDGRTFTGAQQWSIYKKAVSAYFFTLVMCQFWHVWIVKTRLVSIFRHGIFRNKVTIYGVIVSLTVAVLAIYLPAVQNLFKAGYMNIIWWTPHFIFLAIALPFTEWYKWEARRNPTGWVARNIAW